jgi:hypothetical protein
MTQLRKEAFQKAGEHWFLHMRPKHFTEAGAKVYGYTPRRGEKKHFGSKAWKRSYTGRKFAAFKHTRPLVYSGESEAATRLGRIVPTSKGVRIYMTAPRLNYKHPKSKINMREELAMVTQLEMNLLINVYDDHLDRGIRALKETRTRDLTRFISS